MGFFTRKSINDIKTQAEDGEHSLKKTLTATDLVMMGIGAVIGAGLFSITGIAAAQHAGPAIVLSFLIAAIGCTFAGLCYSELASMIPVAGSAYTYVYATMGELAAWIIGWDLILEYAIGSATVAISWSAYIISLLHGFGIYPPAALIASPWQPVRLPDDSIVYGVINLPAFLIVALISWLLIMGVRESTRINTLIVLIKLTVVFLFIGFGIFYINPSNYQPFIPENTGEFGMFGFSGILRAAGIVFFAYVGFDAVSTASQEAKNPQRSIPIGILGSLVICTILYILFSFVLTGIVNYKDLNTAAPVALAIDKTPYIWMNGFIKLGILAGFTSVILVMLYGQSRIFFIMSKDGMFPQWFSSVHPYYKTPWLSNIALMLFVGAFSAFAPISLVGSMTSIGTLLAFVLVCLGVLILRHTHPEIGRPFRTPWVPVIPLLGIGTCCIMIASLGMDNWLRLIIWLCIGVIIYFGYSHKNIKRREARSFPNNKRERN